MNDQQRIETAADNCEVLRARLAKYEDADGNPKAQPSGVVLPEQDGSHAQISFWAGYEFAVSGLHKGNIRSAWNDFKGSRQFGRLNQPATAGKFTLGDRVRKTKGSQWHGTVVGTYSTALTPEGYAVESSTEIGSVQIYPAAALEACE